MFPLNYKSDITYLRNKTIEEYDIISGGYSIVISEKLIDDENFLQYLENSDKKQRQILLGNYTKHSEGFASKLNDGFVKYSNAFIHLNNINADKVLFVKKDAVTFFDSKIKRTKFKKVIFSKRGTYTSFIRIGKLEFYYNGNTKEKLLKGIKLDSIEGTLIEEIFEIMKLAEFSTKDVISRKLKELREAYVKHELIDSYYKELSTNNLYKLNYSYGEDITAYIDNSFASNDDEFFNTVDISYNYNNVLLPLIKIFI